MPDPRPDELPWWRSRRFQQVGTNVFVPGWITYCFSMSVHGGWVALAAACGVVAAVALWWTQFGPRTGRSPAACHDIVGTGGGTVLPRRPGYMAASLTVCFLHPVTAAVFGAWIVAESGRNLWGWGVLVTAPVPLIAGVGVAVGWARGRGRLRLTRAGLLYLPVWSRQPISVSWASIQSVVTDGSVGNGVLVAAGGTRVPIWTAAVGVRHQTLISLLNWYAAQPADRAETQDPRAVAARLRTLETPPVMST